MAKGEVLVNERLCLGCGFCEWACSRGCIKMAEGEFTALGFPLPRFVKPEECNACGVCAWMCPHMAIEVYQYIEPEKAKAG